MLDKQKYKAAFLGVIFTSIEKRPFYMFMEHKPGLATTYWPSFQVMSFALALL